MFLNGGNCLKRGIEVDKISKLTSNSLETSRKDEILLWYNKHVPTEDFVIIDDDKMLNTLPQDIKDKLILTSPSVGLTDDQAEEAIAILQKASHNHLT